MSIGTSPDSTSGIKANHQPLDSKQRKIRSLSYNGPEISPAPPNQTPIKNRLARPSPLHPTDRSSMHRSESTVITLRQSPNGFRSHRLILHQQPSPADPPHPPLDTTSHHVNKPRETMEENGNPPRKSWQSTPKTTTIHVIGQGMTH